MRFTCRSLVVCIAALVAECLGAQQQPATPHLGYAYPAGGKQGEIVEVQVGGQLLKDPSAAFITGQGVQLTVGDYARPMNNKEFTAIRDKLTAAAKTLRGGADARGNLPRLANTTAFERLATEAGVSNADLRAFLQFVRSRRDPKRQQNLQLAETVTLKVTIDAQAPAGIRELRLLTPAGLSNPIRFVVGRLPEFKRAERSEDTEVAADAPEEISTGLPVVLNGQILPGHIDRYTFNAQAGAKLVFSAASRDLIPYLADAVPGWFQPAMTLFDPKGNEVAYADHFRYNQDPVILFKVPGDGKYTLEVRDALYRGREDFVYRVTIGEIPFVTSLFPLGGRVGVPTAVTATGWNLPASALKVAGATDPGTVPVTVGDGKSASNCLPFMLDSLPECLDKKPDDASHPQLVSLPVIIDGRIERPGDSHVFQFKGHTGDKVVAEVVARRLGSPLDSTLQLADSHGRVLAFNDDFDDKGAGLITHQADSYIMTTLPGNGLYTVTLRDAQHKGGPEYGFRLRISPPRPDFELRVVPAGITARAGTNVPVTVYALRRDGFNGDIALHMKDLPADMSVAGAWIPAGSDSVRFTVAVPTSPTSEPLKLQMEGTATIGGKDVHRPAVPAENMMQAFAYWHLVPIDDWVLAVIGRQNRVLRFTSPATPAQLAAGKTTQVHLDGRGGAFEGLLQLTMSDAPDGVTVKSVSGDRSGVNIELQVDPAKAKVGLKGNLIFDISTERTFTPANGKAPVKRRITLGTLPAIPFEIVR